MKVALTRVAIICSSRTLENSSLSFNGSVMFIFPPVLSAISPFIWKKFKKLKKKLKKKLSLPISPNLQFVPSIVNIETETLFFQKNKY